MEENEMNKTEQIRECFLAKARQYLLAGSSDNSTNRCAACQDAETCDLRQDESHRPTRH